MLNSAARSVPVNVDRDDDDDYQDERSFVSLGFLGLLYFIV